MIHGHGVYSVVRYGSIVFGVLLGAVAIGSAQGNRWLRGEATHDSRFSVLVSEIGRFPDPIRDAFASGIALGTANWAWTEHVVSEKRDIASRWDPSRPGFEKIVLLETDGEPPTGKEQKRFFERQSAEMVDSHDDQPTMNRRMVRVVRAMEFVEETRANDGIIRYRLIFNDPDYTGLGWIDRLFVRILTQLTGVVEVGASTPGFSMVHMSLPEPVGLLPGVTIRELVFSLAADWSEEAGTWLPRTVKLDVDGGIWVFGRIARTVEFEFYDYKNVGLTPLSIREVLAWKES